ncbi:MAG: hypothetical protein ACFFF9_03525 [Candidatus Thorarchaeota archaeon]
MGIIAPSAIAGYVIDGLPIPRIFGCMRIAATIIGAMDINHPTIRNILSHGIGKIHTGANKTSSYKEKYHPINAEKGSSNVIAQSTLLGLEIMAGSDFIISSILSSPSYSL